MWFLVKSCSPVIYIMALYFHRDLFIICPAVDMAEFWAANTQSSVHMYHLPEDTAYNRCLSFHTHNIILTSLYMTWFHSK